MKAGEGPVRTTCTHRKDVGWVASVMTQEGLGNGIQPGRSTEWRNFDLLPELDGQK